MSKEPNIDQLFKESFSSFSPEVNGELWANISNQLPSVGSATVTTVAKTSLWKILMGAFTCVLVGVSFTLIYQELTRQNDFEKQIPAKNPSIKALDSEFSDVPLSVVLPETSPYDINDPIINKQTPVVENYKVELLEDLERNENRVINHNQPSSVVNLFLTPRTKRLNIESLNTENSIAEKEEKELKVEISTQEVLNPIINTSVSGGYAPLVVVFDHSELADEVFWEFDDGAFSDESIVEHIFRSPGEYSVSVSITKNGIKAKALKSIHVQSRCIIQKIPNVFTPNGDGENDLFFLEAENIETFFIQIFNLKGKVVFESNNLDAKWDGNDAFGIPLDQGQYLYFIKALGNDKSDLSRTGTVLIKR